jgi:hypothetical protein
MKRTIFALCCVFAVGHAAQASSYSTAEGSFARNIALVAKFYAKDHEGRSPTAWSDLNPYFDLPIDEAFRHILPSKRYAFLTQSLKLPPPYEGDLVVVTRRPFRDSTLYTTWYGGTGRGLREPGRYIIYRTSEGSFQGIYVEEAYIQRAFKGFEHLLPVPDTEPERPFESRVRFWLIIKLVCFAAVAFVFVPRFFRWLFGENGAS